MSWSPPQSVAVLLLATARACPQPVPPELVRRLLDRHTAAIPAEALHRAAAEELQTHYRQGGLRGVFAALQSHCQKLETFLDTDQQRQIIGQMVEVAKAGTDTAEARRRVYAFPYAAARVWGLSQLAAELLPPES